MLDIIAMLLTLLVAVDTTCFCWGAGIRKRINNKRGTALQGSQSIYMHGSLIGTLLPDTFSFIVAIMNTYPNFYYSNIWTLQNWIFQWNPYLQFFIRISVFLHERIMDHAITWFPIRPSRIIFIRIDRNYRVFPDGWWHWRAKIDRFAVYCHSHRYK